MNRLLGICAMLITVCATSIITVADERVSSTTSLRDSATPTASADHPEISPPEKTFKTRSRRILVVTSSGCHNCSQTLQRLESQGGAFERLSARGWKIGRTPENHIQIVDGETTGDVADVVKRLDSSRNLVVVCVKDGKIVRSFQRGCTTPLDQWTFGWLMTGDDERPVAFVPEPVSVITTGNYPLRGNHWSVDGNWSPSREYLIQHLRAVHRYELLANWNIETWSLEELKSVHDDIHDREEGFRGRYGGNMASRSRSSTDGGTGIRKPGKARR